MTYPTNVEFQKYFLSGILEGMTITEHMGFVSWDSACAWAAAVTENVRCNYVVLNMRNLETRQVERF